MRSSLPAEQELASKLQNSDLISLLNKILSIVAVKPTPHSTSQLQKEERKLGCSFLSSSAEENPENYLADWRAGNTRGAAGISAYNSRLVGKEITLSGGG